MKLYRSALMAGLVAIGVAPCGDDVQIVEPTPPPLPPLTATMAPPSATVAVGNSVVFAVNASGGAAGAQASWTCASSNTGIATASTTSAGCQATGVAAGGVTITAAVTKGSEMVNVGAELTVVSDALPPADAIVTIYSVLNPDGSPAVSPISGRVNVVVSLDRGNSTLYGLELLVDGEAVAHQSFTGTGGMAAAPVDDDAAAEQGVLQTVLSVNTAAYEVVDGVGAPDFLNGDHVISARLTLAGADMMAGVALISNEITMRFSNSDRFNLTLSADGTEAMDGLGLIWESGAVTASAVPVIYGGGGVISQVEFALRGAADGSVVRTSRDDGSDLAEDSDADGPEDRDEVIPSTTDDEAPFEASWPNENASSSDQRRVGGIEPGGIVIHILTSAFSDGSAGPVFLPTGDGTADKSYFIRLDNDGPSVSDLHLAMQFNEHYDITNWVGADHAFTFSSDDETPDFRDGGVGRSRTDHEYMAGASTADASAVSSPNDLSETTNDRAYVLGVTVQDLLGNETVRWWAGAEDEDGASDSGTSREEVDDTDDWKFGVDLTAPTQELLDEDDGPYIGGLGVISNIALGATRRSVGIDYDDPGNGAGFDGSSVPVHSRILRHAPEVTREATCIVGNWYSTRRVCEILGQSGSHQSDRGGSEGEYDFDGDGDGYYSVEYAVMDDAGNRADFITAGGVIDGVPPTASVLAPANPEAGERTQFSAFVSDNLDLNQVGGYIVVGDGNADDAYQVTSESVGSPSLPFEQSTTSSGSIESLPAGIGTDAVTGFFARVVDQAGNPGYDQNMFAVGTPVDITADNQDTDTDGIAINYDDAGVTAEDAILCWDTDNDGCADNTETRTSVTFTIDAVEALTQTAVDHDSDPDTPEVMRPESAGFEGLVNPFERVVFYVQVAGEDPDDGTVDNIWAELGEARGRAPENNEDDVDTTVDRQFSWRLTVRAEDLGMATGRTELTGNVDVPVRAVGYTEDGNAVSSDSDVTIALSNEGTTQ